MFLKTNVRHRKLFLALPFAALAIILTKHFSPPELSVGQKIEQTIEAKVAGALNDEGPSAATPPVDLPVASGISPMPDQTSKSDQTADEEISTALVAFKNWAEVYAVASKEEKLELTAKGMPLADARGQAMAALIKQDPLAAIQALLPYTLRKALPPEIAARIEHRVSGVGDLLVVAVTPLPGTVKAEPIYRTAKLAEKNYRAYVYGSRSNDISRIGTRILGVGVKSVTTAHLVAVREEAYEVLDPAEAADLDPDREQTDCPVSENPTASQGGETAVDTGDKIVWLCSGGHISEWLASPDGAPVAAAGGSGSSSGVSPVMPATWTQGHKTFLAIRVRFADQPLGYQPASDEVMQTELKKVVDILPLWSYGKMTGTFAFTHTINLPGTSASYAVGGMNLLSLARQEAANYTDASGGQPYNTANFDFDAVVFNADWFRDGGEGLVGAKGTMIKTVNSHVFLHEWGHNFSLWHASYWQPTTDSPIGVGNHIDYGNVFSTQGIFSNQGSFTSQERFQLQWLESANLPSVSSSGIHRIYNADTTTLISGRNYALKLDKDETNYFVEYRPNWSPIKKAFTAENGAMIIRQRYYELIDMTPMSSAGAEDAPLLIGHSFHDPNYEVTVTPIARGGTAPNDYLDVAVNFNSSLTNTSPRAVVTTSNETPAVGQSVILNASASDQDNDKLAYAWDFGDGSNMSVNNSSSQTKSWSTAGTYNVRCTVSDMKGKTFVKNLSIRVGTPSTFTVSGRITQVDGTPVQNILVKTTTTQPTYTDADGRYSIGPLLSSSYTIIALRDGWELSAPAASPLTVSSTVANFNFTATPLLELRGITQEHWSNISGTTLTSLKNHPDYPAKPTYTRTLTSVFEASKEIADNYGRRVRGYFIPPTTGNYTFYISSDEESELHLSSTDLAETNPPIASVKGWTYFREWDRFGSQKSRAIRLTAGQRYYIEALHKEGTKNDHLSVGVDFPDGTEHRPIEATYLRPIPRPVIPPTAPVIPPTAPPSTTVSTLPDGYVKCSNEGESLTFFQETDLAYGVGSAFVIKRNQKGDITFNNDTFGDPVGNQGKYGYCKTSSRIFMRELPEGYIQCVNEGQSQLFPEETDLAYGIGNSFIVKLKQKGNVTFNNGTFGDPIGGASKIGYYRLKSIPVGPQGYRFATMEWLSYKLPGLCDVAFGMDNSFLYRYGVTGTIIYDQFFFGGDPVQNAQKYGFYKLKPVISATLSLPNSLHGGVNGDADSDGIPNGIEYALQTNLDAADGQITSVHDNVVSFTKRAVPLSNHEVSYRIEVSDDLGVNDAWAELTSTEDVNTIKAMIPQGTKKCFFRLRVDLKAIAPE
jgi:PKD domain/PA14 domain